jgi:hypothetical protein
MEGRIGGWGPTAPHGGVYLPSRPKCETSDRHRSSDAPCGSRVAMRAQRGRTLTTRASTAVCAQIEKMRRKPKSEKQPSEEGGEGAAYDAQIARSGDSGVRTGRKGYFYGSKKKERLGDGDGARRCHRVKPLCTRALLL